MVRIIKDYMFFLLPIASHRISWPKSSRGWSRTESKTVVVVMVVALAIPLLPPRPWKELLGYGKEDPSYCVSPYHLPPSTMIALGGGTAHLFMR